MSWKWQSILSWVLLALASRIDALDPAYCASGNTGGGFQGQYSPYMSNGKCQTICQGSYVFAVVQGNMCWCSNVAPDPALEVNTLQCNQVCPGFNTEWCGSTQAGLFVYFNLGGRPTATAGGASPPVVAPSTKSTSPPSPVVSVSTEVVISTAPNPSSIDDSPDVPPTETQVYTSIMTVTGKVKTVLVTPTSAIPAATPDPTLGQGATRKSGVSTGAVVGIVVGVVLGLGLLIGLAVFFWLRRRNRNQERGLSPGGSYRGSPGRSNGPVPSRQVSQLSSSTLLGKASHKNGLGPSNTTRSVETASSTIDRRSLATDQRLNPHALYSHDEGMHSSVSLQDNHDYSRQLRVANPDL